MALKRLVKLGGGSIGVLIPRETARAAGLRIGDVVEVRLRRRVVEVVPLHPRPEPGGERPWEVPP